MNQIKKITGITFWRFIKHPHDSVSISLRIQTLVFDLSFH